MTRITEAVSRLGHTSIQEYTVRSTVVGVDPLNERVVIVRILLMAGEIGNKEREHAALHEGAFYHKLAAGGLDLAEDGVGD